jgi:hypothetical protein
VVGKQLATSSCSLLDLQHHFFSLTCPGNTGNAGSKYILHLFYAYRKICKSLGDLAAIAVLAQTANT